MKKNPAAPILARLQQRGFLTAEQTLLAERLAADAPNPARLVERLVEHGLLTAWQAEQLRSGGILQLGKYILLEQVRQEGAERVFLARHAPMDRLVLLLAIRRRDDQQTRQQILQQAHRTSVLNHAHLSHVYDFDHQDGYDFIVMEHVQGSDLQEVLDRKTRLDAAQITRWMIQAAEGLQHVHEHGLWHGQIRPQMLLLDPRSSIKVRIWTASQQQPGGRRPYGVDQDMADLGQVLHQLLTSCVPDRPASSEVQLREQLHDLTERMRDPDLSQRPASMTDIAQQLRAWTADYLPAEEDAPAILAESAVADRPRNASATGPDGEPVRSRPRPRWPLVAAGLAGCLLLTVTLAAVLFRGSEPSRSTGENETTAVPSAATINPPTATTAAATAAPVASSTDTRSRLEALKQQWQATAQTRAADEPNPDQSPTSSPPAADNKSAADASSVPVAPQEMDSQTTEAKPEATTEAKPEAKPSPDPPPATAAPTLSDTAATAAMEPNDADPKAPPVDPFTQLPESITLPTGEAADRPLTIGPVALQTPDVFANLLGSEQAHRGTVQFHLQQVPGQPAWDVSLRQATGRTQPIGQFAIANQELRFHWHQPPPTVLAQHLANCLLQLRQGNFERVVALRQPLEQEPLELALSRGAMRHNLRCSCPPDPDALQLQLTIDSPASDGTPETLQLGAQSSAGEVPLDHAGRFALHAELHLDRTLSLTLTPLFRPLPGRPWQKLTAATIQETLAAGRAAQLLIAQGKLQEKQWSSNRRFKQLPEEQRKLIKANHEAQIRQAESIIEQVQQLQATFTMFDQPVHIEFRLLHQLDASRSTLLIHSSRPPENDL